MLKRIALFLVILSPLLLPPAVEAVMVSQSGTGVAAVPGGTGAAVTLPGGGGGAIQTGTGGGTTGAAGGAPAQSVDTTEASNRRLPSISRQVVNIVFDRMEGGYVYARDGRRFAVSSQTRVIENAHPASNMKVAELIFDGRTLISVTIK